ncbi:MAG TPA: hypothetical protein VGZ71_04035 [Puia sp.]|nr:hypothetical protein [Puia sp.]
MFKNYFIEALRDIRRNPGLTLLMLSALTISYQAVNAALTNPVNGLRMEWGLQ